MLPKWLQVQLFDVLSIIHYKPFLTVIEPFQQLHHSTFALATFSHQSILFVLQKPNAHIIQHFVVSVRIRKYNILELNLPLERSNFYFGRVIKYYGGVLCSHLEIVMHTDPGLCDSLEWWTGLAQSKPSNKNRKENSHHIPHFIVFPCVVIVGLVPHQLRSVVKG